MITFEQIQKANESIKLTEIKGKMYAEVNQRIKAFRMVCPNGAIVNDVSFPTPDVCVCKTTIVDENGTVIGTGTALEEKQSSYINKTSFVENCETSAVGRALGMCGFGIDTAICSAEELENALNSQEAKKLEEQIKKAEETPVDKLKMDALVEQSKKDGVDLKKVYEMYGVKTRSEMTMKVFSKINTEWNKVKEECKIGE